MIVTNMSNYISSASDKFATTMYENFLSKHDLEPDTEFVNFKHDYLVLEPGLTHFDYADCLTEDEYQENIKLYEEDGFMCVAFHPHTQLAILHENNMIADEIYNNPKYYQ
tara:strand:+ start:1598 stop:1927 length:330 start_codon:yes stop_codon:yes gene_type:complete